ncbi:hypothetical protein NX722_25270 [Endozoicomonas gorgoniicola]|uniref:HTH iclR-type domain-containing protein n=1 Tax=Endozoicomonas gorgoniicola TaxID=1234144 RepID=A0ABT3N2L1_9GAMM|nr:hypothetical protein [Endozoicomonas gorgoniicola]MCW7555878.1 hypothetical protein [Endozoicomonas gorgoniicola]
MARHQQPALIKAMGVWKALSENGFRGRTATELRIEFDMPKSTCWRILKTLEEGNWVVRKPGGRQREDIWQISPSFLEVLAKYRQYMMGRVQGVKDEYRAVTKEDLEA